MAIRIYSVLPVLLGAAAILLAGCSSDDAASQPEPRQVEANTGNNGPLFGGQNSETITVNSYLWRASLDTMSFLPLNTADPFGGVIITDWYSPPETPTERFKVTVYILDRELRADGLRVAVFRQVREGEGAWVEAKVDDRTARDLENAILKRARQMRIRGG
jgi:hypothetical protein